jgi:hypothetical protein
MNVPRRAATTAASDSRVRMSLQSLSVVRLAALAYENRATCPVLRDSPSSDTAPGPESALCSSALGGDDGRGRNPVIVDRRTGGPHDTDGPRITASGAGPRPIVGRWSARRWLLTMPTGLATSESGTPGSRWLLAGTRRTRQECPVGAGAGVPFVSTTSDLAMGSPARRTGTREPSHLRGRTPRTRFQLQARPACPEVPTLARRTPGRGFAIATPQPISPRTVNANRKAMESATTHPMMR